MGEGNVDPVQGKPDAEVSRAPPTLARRIDILVAALVIVFSLGCVAGALSELQKRAEIEATASRAIGDIEKLISESVDNEKENNIRVNLASSLTTDQCNLVSFMYSNNLSQYRSQLKNAIEAYRIRVLTGEAKEINGALKYITFVVSCRSILATRFFDDKSNAIVVNGSIPETIAEAFDSLFVYFGNMTNNSLLIIIVVGCGCIGAVASGLNTNDPSSLRDMVRGSTAGFVIYLGIKGGKYVFITSHGADYSEMNHYGIAFASIIVGLYLEWAQKVFQQLLKGIEAGVGVQAAGSNKGQTP